MKKLILILTVSAFSIGAYAGGKESAAKGQAACCADKAKAGATCQDAKAACCEKSLAGKNVKKCLERVLDARASALLTRWFVGWRMGILIPTSLRWSG